DLAAAIDEVARFAEQQRLGDVERRAHALRDELDRPLLLAILGEFNAGKSTLVNAFVGADVAPTGILPTTATLNVLRGGAERRVRLVKKDGTTQEGGYEQLKAMLKDAEEAEAEIDHVEIVLPSELLERVWILDTPGSNAPLPEHEALAAEALRRADAALWVFDSGQAGKATEGKILSAIRASRRHVVGALNKVDRLSPDQLDAVRASLSRELPEIADSVVALSARSALKARLASDDAAWQASGFVALLERLEADVFGRSRHLKRRACGGRLLALLDDALVSERDASMAGEARVAELEAARGPLDSARLTVIDAVDDAMDGFEAAQNEAFDAAAVEVLSFVRPRTNRFAVHGADIEDRAFLGEVIEARLERAVARAERSLADGLARALAAPTRALELTSAELDGRVLGAVRPAVARFAGYQGGLLTGGALRRFFEEDLPRAELAKEPLAEALRAARAEPRELLRPVLREAVSDLMAELEGLRQRRVGESQDALESLRARLYEPLRALREVLEELVD
ncbi:MAG: dynamin family protein, partial [Sandaracinaceae bacterium]